MGLIQYINSKAFLEYEAAQPRASTFEISNLGSFQIDPTYEIQITDMIFSQPLGAVGSCFGCNVVGTSNGGLNMCLTTTKGLNHQTFVKYTEGVERWINFILKNN
ncbi:unnamed protein product [Ambrosiozyma monospora]|uniref:Unnamed protein product n=1 Tax=Ambrosiozyma monospora TaxID=43982 RepID=A0ACB5TI07_AMBMO|nr:unnamed protein product [Ambrosiozyma monospora]